MKVSIDVTLILLGSNKNLVFVIYHLTLQEASGTLLDLDYLTKMIAELKVK